MHRSSVPGGLPQHDMVPMITPNPMCNASGSHKLTQGTVGALLQLGAGQGAIIVRSWGYPAIKFEKL